MNKKRTSRALVLATAALVLLVAGLGACARFCWPGLRASWIVSQRTDSRDRFASLMQIVEDERTPFDARILALQRAPQAYDAANDHKGTIRLTTSGLALLTNETYRPLIEKNARFHGEDPDEQIHVMLDLAYCMRGMALASVGRYEEALADLKQVSESGRKQNGWRKAVGVSAYYTHRFALAATALSAYLASHDDEVSYHEMLALSQLNTEQHEQALSNCLHVISVDANRVAPYIYAAGIMSTSKDDSLRDGERALEFVEKGLSLTTNPPSFFFDMKACALAELGRFDEAVEYAQMALTIATTEASGERRNEEYKEVVQKQIDSFTQGIPWRE